MKICFLEGDMSRNGGTERMTAWLANQLSENNQIHILSMSMTKQSDPFFSLNDKIILKNFKVNEIGLRKTIIAIRNYVKLNNIDCIINVDVGMGFYGILACLGLKTKVITWEHSNFFNNWNSKIFPYLRKTAAKYSDEFVVLTNKDKSNYQSHIKLSTPIHVIPNPIERHEISYDEDSKTILSVGQLNNVKRFDRVIELGKEIFAIHPEWNWKIFGDGPEKSHLEYLIKQFHLENNIFLMGAESNQNRIYHDGSFLVMTSETEGLPMVLLEAKSYGLPLISFDIMTGPSDIILDNINGFLVPMYDMDEMKNKILTLIENTQLRNEFAKNSYLNIEKFEKEGIMKKWKEIIKK